MSDLLDALRYKRKFFVQITTNVINSRVLSQNLD